MLQFTGKTAFSDKLHVILVQLAKIKNNDKIKASISKELRDWAEFFSDPNAIESSDEGMKDAQKLWNRISANDQLKAQQRAQDKYQRDKDSEIAINREEGRQEGLAEGLEKGEYKKAIETAKNLLAMGLSIEQISRATSLTVDKIQGLM